MERLGDGEMIRERRMETNGEVGILQGMRREKDEVF
jgi:hypothetical protein